MAILKWRHNMEDLFFHRNRSYSSTAIANYKDISISEIDCRARNMPLANSLIPRFVLLTNEL